MTNMEQDHELVYGSGMHLQLSLVFLTMVTIFLSGHLPAKDDPVRGEWRILLAQDGVFFKAELLTDRMNSPWDFHFLNDEEIIFSSRDTGKIQKYNTIKNVFVDIHKFSDVNHYGVGGLLGIALDPNFHQNNILFAYYSYTDREKRFNKLVRLSLTQKKSQILLDKIPHGFWHNGGRLAFTSPNTIMVTTGDGEHQDNAQDKKILAGKILRIHSDGKIPLDNPQSGSPVWSIGHRNPQGLVFIKDLNEVWSTEHGDITNDELNIISKGKNYGWPSCAGKDVCADIPNYTPAAQIFYQNDTIAVSDLFYYKSDLIPNWDKSLFLSSLKSGIVYRVKIEQGKVKSQNLIIGNEFGRIRDITQDGKGYIYFVTDRGTRSRLYKLSPLDKW